MYDDFWSTVGFLFGRALIIVLLFLGAWTALWLTDHMQSPICLNSPCPNDGLKPIIWKNVPSVRREVFSPPQFREQTQNPAPTTNWRPRPQAAVPHDVAGTAQVPADGILRVVERQQLENGQIRHTYRVAQKVFHTANAKKVRCLSSLVGRHVRLDIAVYQLEKLIQVHPVRMSADSCSVSVIR